MHVICACYMHWNYCLIHVHWRPITVHRYMFIFTFNIFRTILSSMSHFVFPLTEREPINTSAGLWKKMKIKLKINCKNLHNLVEHMLKLMNHQLRKTSDAKMRTWDYKQIKEQSEFVIVESRWLLLILPSPTRRTPAPTQPHKTGVLFMIKFYTGNGVIF